MEFVKVSDRAYVNLNNVFYVTLCHCDIDNYKWAFWSMDGHEDHYVYSQSFSTREEAEEWLENLLSRR